MVVGYNPGNPTSFPVSGGEPSEGRKYAPLTPLQMDLNPVTGGAGGGYNYSFKPGLKTFNLQFNLQNAGISQVCGLWIDNSQNPFPLFMRISSSGQILRIPPKCQAWRKVMFGSLSDTIVCYVNPVNYMAFNVTNITVSVAALNWEPIEKEEFIIPTIGDNNAETPTSMYTFTITGINTGFLAIPYNPSRSAFNISLVNHVTTFTHIFGYYATASGEQVGIPSWTGFLAPGSSFPDSAVWSVRATKESPVPKSAIYIFADNSANVSVYATEESY